MEKIRVCLAIGNREIEEWMKEKLAEYCKFVGVAIHREQILTMLSQTMPDVLVFDVNLPTSKLSGISVDELILKIKTNYSSCRPILLCGNQVPGDEFLTRMVGRGVYDIVCGDTISIQDVCTMIFTPKDYAYASTLQALDVVSDTDMGVRRSQVMQQPTKEQSTVHVQPQKPVVQQPVIQQADEEYSEEYSGVEDTSVLTSDMISGPRGIVFSPVEEYSEYAVIKSGVKEVGFTSDGYRNDNVLYSQGPQYQQYQPQYGKLLAFTSARQGVGCTSSVINTAMAFACRGKKVLLMDATFGRSSVYQRLGLPESYGFTVEDTLAAYMNRQDISQMAMGKQRIQNTDSERQKYLPDNLFFLRFSNEFDMHAELIGFDRLLDGFLQYYDYILVDTSISDPKVPTLLEIMKKAVRVVLVTLQDVYEVNTANQIMIDYNRVVQISSKLIVLVNRYQKKGSPKADMIASALGALSVHTFKDDCYGYMCVSAAGKAYYPFAKKKIREAYEQLITVV